MLAGCGGSAQSSPRKHLLVVVNAPFSRTPYLGQTIENGVRLAASEVNASGLRIDGTSYDLKVQTMDSALSPARALANVRRAANEHAIAVVDEGTGIDASWRVARGMPIGIVFQGGKKLVDPATRPNVFRIAPTDHGIAFRLAEYLVPKGLKVGLLHDDSGYGSDGGAALREAFSQNESSVALDETVPADARRPRPADPARTARPRDRAPRLGPAGHDRGGDHRCTLGGLERPVLHAAGRRRPVRPAATGRPSVVGRRPDLRGRPADGRGRQRAVHHLRAEVRSRLRRRPRRREDARRARR